MRNREGVLVVDDDRDACDAIAAALEQVGYVVETSTDPLEALSMLATFVPDLLLTDLQMPRMDGLELIHRVRASGTRVPAVLMTGAAETYDLCTGANAYGAVACLVKPINLEQLIWTIDCAVACRTRPRGMTLPQLRAV
jgi:CheY-like chemotaxis protein